MVVLKWGIVSAGAISTEFVKALSILPSLEQIVVAVAARELCRAENFAAVHNIPKAYGDYESLALDKDIDVVYIANLNPQHLKVSKLMLDHGKHVLCEKPLTMNEKQTKELIEYARSKKLFLMEAIWSRFFPAYEKLQAIINAGDIGDVLYVGVTFGKSLTHKERINKKELGGGTILDLGVYVLQLQQLIFKGLTPITITATGHLNEFGIDESANACITYQNGKTAVLSTHARIELPNEAVIVGTNGMITIPRFWCATRIHTPSGTVSFDLPQTTVNFKSVETVGLSYEANEVRRCIAEGLLESPKMPHSDSLELAALMDRFRKDLGVVFVEDLE